MHESLTDTLDQLNAKFTATGQSLAGYLDGLLQADYLTYWDYIHLETLLTLQKPKTAYPDELIFVTYHQITELYFKLILHEIAQIADAEPLTAAFFTARMQRVNRYFTLLEESFSVVVTGMEREQFLKFRMALLPTSGFQSAQFRQIEIVSTDLANLTNQPASSSETDSISALYEKIYWKQGATDLATQQPTFTLQQFDKHYGPELMRLADEYQSKNISQRYRQLAETGQSTPELAETLREYDWRVNIRWKLAHLRSAVQHLKKETATIEVTATGGTNWQTYLPPRHQQRVFFPMLWSDAELQSWGQNARHPNQ
jgi:tryptophan 2,3-dioxygenase